MYLAAVGASQSSIASASQRQTPEDVVAPVLRVQSSSWISPLQAFQTMGASPVVIVAEVEERIKACMGRAGFAYWTAQAPSDPYWTVGSYWNLRLRDGYGFTRAVRAIEPASFLTATRHYLSLLAPRRRAQYFLILNGTSAPVIDGGSVDLINQPASAPGCRAEAIREVLNPLPLGLTSFDRAVIHAELSALTSAATAAAAVRWRACMRTLAIPAQFYDAVSKYYESLPQPPPNAGVAWFKRELYSAAADAACYLRAMWPVQVTQQLAIGARLTREFPRFAEEWRLFLKRSYWVAPQRYSR